MADFPFSQSDSIQYDGPALFVRGTKSQYVSDDVVPAIKKFFPSAQIADVNAGHWLISEKPEEFRQGEIHAALVIDTSYRTDRRPNSRGQIFRVFIKQNIALSRV